MMNPSYRKAFYYAMALHLLVILLLFVDTSSKRPALTMDSKNTPGIAKPQLASTPPDVVKAVSVDNNEVMQAVNRLKQERAKQLKTEKNRQKALEHQAQLAKQQRIKEQQEIARLKEEANTIAIARKKQAEEEKKRLKQLAEQKAKEAKQIEALKKKQQELVRQQELEKQKLAELNKKKTEEKARAEKLKVAKLQEEKLKAEKAQAEKIKAEQVAKAEMERRKQAEALAAQRHAESQARIAGEVDKYKALIVNAIGRYWILPENADSGLSSQFRIRLAPDGMVLEVTLTRSSGDPLLDRSAQTAIYKASPLPVPTDAEAFNVFRDISLTVRPEQVRG